MASARELLEEAKGCLDKGEALSAVGSLRRLAEEHALHETPELLASTLGLLSEVLLANDMAEFAQQCRAAVALDPQAVYDTGMMALQVGLPRLAIPMLAFTDLAAPGEEGVLYPLASALEESGLHGRAWRLVQESATLTGFMADYLVAFNALCAGEADVAAAVVAGMVVDPEIPHGADMLERVQSMVARYHLARPHTALDGGDLRGWHYVLHGGQHLHLSPFGYPDPMKGRFAWLQDDVDRINLGLRRAIEVLRAWDRLPSVVLAPPDECSARVAGAMARRLGVEVQPWSAEAEGLVVVYDLALVDAEVQIALCDRRHQLLFAHAMSWTDGPPTVPDLVTVQYQSLVAPWDERIVMDGEETEVVGPSTESDAHWVDAILAGDDSEDDDMPEADALDRLVGFARAVGPSVGERRYWGPGPVRSARFM